MEKNPDDGASAAAQSSNFGSTAGNKSSAQIEPLPSLRSLVPKSNDGSISVPYTIVVPPGRNGFQPAIQLTYNSHDFDIRSQFGMGWSISIPSIQRLNKTGIDLLYATSTFASSIDGELMQVGTSNVFRPRVDDGSYRSYQLINNTSWLVTDKDGNSYFYGTTSAARYENPGDTTKKFKWMLEQAADLNGNTINYQYTSTSSELYPSKILYGGTATTGPLEIDFVTEARPDVQTSYAAGYLIKTVNRIKEIDTFANGTSSRKYALSYVMGENGSRTLLGSTTESAWDSDGNITTLPPTSFSYSTSTKTWTNVTSQWTNPEEYFSMAGVGGDLGVRAVDINNDGLTDVVRWHSNAFSSDTKLVYINTGTTSQFQLHSEIVFPEFITEVQQSKGVYLMDVNNDGRVDVIRSYGSNPGVPISQKVYLASTTTAYPAWDQDTNWSMPFIVDVGSDWGIRFADVNGDNLPDVVQSSLPTGIKNVWLNTGSAWVATSTPTIPTSFASSGNTRGVWLVDANSDGLADIVQATEFETPQVFINTGVGGANFEWVQDNTYSIPFQLSAGSGGYTRGFQVMDINTDKLPDFVQSWNTGSSGGARTQHAHITKSYGDTWNTDDTATTLPEPFAWDNFDAGTRITDINGDGLDDLSRDGDDGTHFWNTTYIRNGGAADLLTSVTSPDGGSISYSYKAAGTITDSSGNRVNKMSTPVDVVSTTTVNDLNGNIETLSYDYAGGYFWTNGPEDRKFAGFKSVEETRDDKITTSYYSQGDGNDSSLGEQNDQFALIGKPFRTDVTTPAGTVLKRTWTRYGVQSQDGNRYLEVPSDSIDQSFNSGGSYRTRAQHRDTDPYGHPSSVTDYGEVTLADGLASSYSDTGSDLIATHFEWATTTASSTNPSAPTNFVSHETETNYSGAQIAETKHLYDGLVSGSVANGNETQTQKWKSGSAYATTKQVFNGYGLVTSSVDARGSTTTVVYDSSNLYPATTTNPLGHVEVRTYDLKFGKPTQIVDVNGATSTIKYDGLGRVVEKKGTDSTGTLVKMETTAYTDTSGAVSVLSTKWITDAQGIASYDYKDGLGRSIQNFSQATGTQWVAKDTVYDAHGHAYKESLPYFASASSKAPATTTGSLFTTYTYDSVDRPLTAQTTVGTTGYSYGTWDSTITNENGIAKDTTNDARGNLVQVVEHNSTSTYTTTYSYDGLNDLTNITDALSNVRNFTYDGLGRRLTAEDLHASADTTYGTSTYAYDDAGNLTQKVDPKGQVVNYTYDALNRPLTEDYTGQAGTEITYKYDNCPSGKGRLCNWITSGASSTTQYNPFGAVRQETKTIGGADFTLSYLYDRLGNIATTTYPDNSQVQNVYNGAGQLNAVQRKESTDSGFTSIISLTDYSPLGQVSYRSSGNGAITSNTYDPSHLYRLTRKLTTGVATSTVTVLGTPTTVSIYAGTGDGHVIAAAKTTWALAHDASTGTSLNSTSTTFAVEADKSDNSGTRFHINRGYITFDTSSIPAGAVISAATLGLWVSAVSNTAALNLVIATSTQAATSTLATADFPRVGSATSSDVVHAPAASATSTWTLNSTGIAAINIGTSTKFSIREQHDLNNLAATNTAVTSATFTSANGSASHRPVLVITYSTSSQAAGTPTTVQDIQYSYDAVGNITKTINNSNTDEAATTTYAYDDLNRLLSASSTGAVSGNFLKTYTYNAIGNIASSTDSGAYAYAGNYANPHAPTTIGSTAYTYDNNGNVTSYGTTTVTWDWRNRITKIVGSGATTTYAYDINNERIQLAGGGSTTTFPFMLYNVASSTSAKIISKHLFANGEGIADVQGTGASAKAYNIHGDHAGGADIVSNASSTMENQFAYHAYGKARIKKTSANLSEQRQYIGQEYDQGSDLNYHHDRYYNSTRGQFLSEEPIYLSLGDSDKVKTLSQEDQQIYLRDPQQLNSYSYARNNPGALKDPSGRQAVAVAALGAPGLAPIAIPAAIISVVAVETYYGTQALLRQSGGREYGRLDRDQQASLPAAPNPVFDPLPPNFDDKTPKWKIITWAGLTIGGLAADEYGKYQTYSDGAKDAQLPNAPTDTQGKMNWGSLNLQSSQAPQSYYAQQHNSSLPSTVVQDGVSYVRNSSGLLNIANTR
ncbi:SpvB/TcaC N-terminal domain-containing protein [Bradyrhizobium sp. AZCC 2262]|uniref:SpvB/TcaC N-terminal domain-containing protein n=1 Tax=Bradyrhizobium sp. AZCC 2262 TaxID=3117022 RepID=UPI002FF413DF